MASLVAAIVTMRGEFFAVSLALVAALRRAVCTFLRRRVFFEAGRLVVLRPREFWRCGDDSDTWQAGLLWMSRRQCFGLLKVPRVALTQSVFRG